MTLTTLGLTGCPPALDCVSEHPRASVSSNGVYPGAVSPQSWLNARLPRPPVPGAPRGAAISAGSDPRGERIATGLPWHRGRGRHPSIVSTTHTQATPTDATTSSKRHERCSGECVRPAFLRCARARSQASRPSTLHGAPSIETGHTRSASTKALKTMSPDTRLQDSSTTSAHARPVTRQVRSVGTGTEVKTLARFCADGRHRGGVRIRRERAPQHSMTLTPLRRGRRTRCHPGGGVGHPRDDVTQGPPAASANAHASERNAVLYPPDAMVNDSLATSMSQSARP